MSRIHHFRDFDAFAQSVGDVDCVMAFRNPTSHLWSIGGVTLPGGIHVQQGWLGSGNLVEGQSHVDGYVFYLPRTNGIEYLVNGKILGENAFAILEPGSEFCISTKVAHDWCSIFIPTHQFARGGNQEEPEGRLQKMTCRATGPLRQGAHQIRACVDQIMTAAAHCSSFESTPAATSAGTALLKATSLIAGERQAGEPNQKGRPKLPRQKIICLCQELLEKRDGELVGVEALAAAADVSERTLRTAFHEYYGMGPVDYLHLRQLHRVHRALKASDPEVQSVTDVLTSHGLWQLGRFASRYRRLFGKLPSETLRAKRR